MKRQFFKIIFVSIVLCPIILLGRQSSAEQLISVKDAIKGIFASFDSVEEHRFVFLQEQMAMIEEKAGIIFSGNHSESITVYTVKSAQGIMGYAFEDTVHGKWGPIHYLVGLDPAWIILEVVILDYTEIRGKPISKKRFLKQYKGKTIGDAVVLRKDIDGVTGATISSRSLTDGVRKILNGYQFLKEDLILGM